MRARHRLMILAVFLAVTPICTRAFAAEPATAGIYAISDTAVVGSIKTISGEPVSPITEPETGTVYPDAGQFSVTCPGTTSGKDYAVFVVRGNEKPSDENTVYVNQKTAAGNTLVFRDIIPKDLTAGQYRVYVTGGGKVLNTAQPLATFSYREITYTLTVSVDSEKTDDTVKLRLWKDGKEIALSNNTSSDAAAVFLCGGLTAGNYTLTLEKEGYVTRTESLTLMDNTAWEFTLYKRGDIDGNHSVLNENYGVLDMQCLYTYLSENRNEGQIANEVYFKRVADVNGDGVVNILDYQCLYELILESAKAEDYSQYGTDITAMTNLSADNIFKLEAIPSTDKTRVYLTLTLTGTVKLCGFDMTLHYNKDAFTLSELDTEKDLALVSDRQDSNGTVTFNYGNAKNITKGKTVLTASFTAAKPLEAAQVFWLSPVEVTMIGKDGLNPVSAPYLLTYQKIEISD